MEPYKYLDTTQIFYQPSFTNLILRAITHKDMASIIKGAIGSVAGSAEAVDNKAESTSSSFLDRLGDKIFGPTAESKTNDAPIVAPDASTIPVTEGRRSGRKDGTDPFRSGAPAAPAQADKS